jgi:ribonuclease E
VEEGTYVTCAQCGGTGRVRSLESIALTILRTIQMHVAKGNIAVVEGDVSMDLADFLLNEKRGEIIRMETTHKVQVHLKGKPDLYHHAYRLDFIEKKAEKEEKPVAQPNGSAEPKKEVDPKNVAAKGNKGKKRPRRKAAAK